MIKTSEELELRMARMAFFMEAPLPIMQSSQGTCRTGFTVSEDIDLNPMA